MTNIDFLSIRSHNGSQAGGFEELVCQIAHLRRPEGAVRFVRKEGAGGDAGVECYWILNDQTEICWQAKYFMGQMNASRWGQLDKSFATALDRHPNLTKYVICLPIDKPDSRSKRAGKQVVTTEDEWQRHVAKWRGKAESLSRSVEFEFWGKHELLLFLTTQDPQYSGKLLYWFDSAVLTTHSFNRTVTKAKQILKDRYDCEFHVDLPIAGSFDGLCLNDQWRSDLGDRLSRLERCWDSFFRKLRKQQPELLDGEKVEELKDGYSEVHQILLDGVGQRLALFDVQQVKALVDEISEHHDPIREGIYSAAWQSESDRDYTLWSHQRFFRELEVLSRFLKTKKVKAAEVRAALVWGEAGIGKSHLLCDISLRRTEENQPTILLLGSQYQGGNPIELIQEALDLKQYRMEEVLGAIDAAAEALGSRALIAIDAINEGNHIEDWLNQISSFLSDVAEFPHIAVLLSCRSTYLRYILPGARELDDDRLVWIEHPGFRGHEHRAAERYLSRHGIAKPSVPILAPEFTNPLFLKTCCRALKASKQTTFPKGFNGITRLFRFYIESIEKAIAKQKHFTPEERIVECALLDFASGIFPGRPFGISKGEARKSINALDPNPIRGKPLFDTLLHEGVLSEDISYEASERGEPIVRFTFERFSDHFVAQQITQNIDSGFLDSIFGPDEPLGNVIREYGGFPSHAGIFEMLAIIIAEKYGKELVDLLPENARVSKSDADAVFRNSVVWRTPVSFSDRTLELLNQLRGWYGTLDPAWDILLKLSTEPGHPWNAELLHRKLLDREIAERDQYWSTQLALDYGSEEDDGYESTIRTLIEWAGFGNLEETEEERIRLCSITLLWFLTTSNRKVRDRSTKALVRMLSCFPSLLPDLLQEFHSVNDLYVVERLYAVAYGVICNTADPQFVSRIAALVFELVFKDGSPLHHILLRDYARGILEFALHKDLLPDDVDIQRFRPPYKSEWPIENPTAEEIDTIVGDEQNKWIVDSVSGPLGDFGIYTMSCIHDWSPTPLTEPMPETSYEIKKQFAETHLQGEVLRQFLEEIEPSASERRINLNALTDLRRKVLDVDSENGTQDSENQSWNDGLNQVSLSYEEERKHKEEFEKTVIAQIGDSQREHYRWLSGLRDGGTAQFSRKWAQRWVCKRAYEFGWTDERFSSFDGSSQVRFSRYRGNQEMERIGKKYQWLALFEVLARMSDNVHWIAPDYDNAENKSYSGPWQIRKRDIDPTIGIRKYVGHLSDPGRVNTWWQPYDFPLGNITDLPAQTDYLWDEQRLPEFQDFLQVEDPVEKSKWTVLRGFWQEDQRERFPNPNFARLDCWFRINSILVCKEALGLAVEKFRTSMLSNPAIINVPSTDLQGFLGEYPWHPVYNRISGWQNTDSFGNSNLPMYLSPVSEYEWEIGGSIGDFSLDSSLSFYLPAKELVEDMSLKRSARGDGSWKNDGGEIFRDPSLVENGPRYALIRSQQFDEWLDRKGLAILWLIGGEKQLFSHDTSKFYGRLTYSTMYRLVDGMPTGGSFWFSRTEPRDDL